MLQRALHSKDCRSGLTTRSDMFMGASCAGSTANEIGDWCAELVVDDQTLEEVFDHHLTVATMRALKICGTEISDDVLSQGAEGEDFSGRSEGD